MALANEKPLTLEEFLAWEQDQPARYEYVGGVARLMTGGTRNHAVIITNIVSRLRSMLRGSPCFPFGENRRIPIPDTENSRYPDAVIDCGKGDPNAYNAAEPTVVFEVLSKSTRLFDITRKVDDYSSITSIRQYVVVSQSELAISVWQRRDDGDLVKRRDLFGPDAILLLHRHPDMPEITLTMKEIYEETGLLEGSVTEGPDE